MNCSINLIALDAVIFNHKTTYSNIIIINAPYLFYVQFLRALNIGFYDVCALHMGSHS